MGDQPRSKSDYLEALFATWWAGLIAVPINAKLSWTGSTLAVAHRIYCGTTAVAVADADTNAPAFRGDW